MKKLTLAFVLLALMLGGTCGMAVAGTAAIIAIENAPAGNGLTAAKVKDGITEAATARGWQISVVSATELEATLHNRQHMVKVRIPYTAKTYSIVYKDSENMKYNASKNTIHSSYTRWVNTLSKDIELKLQTMK